MSNSITVYNLDREPYYNLSLNKIIGKFSIYFIMTISSDIVINLSIYELISLQNYIYQFYNSDTLLEPIVLQLSPSNKYMEGHMIVEPYNNYGHMVYYEGLSISIFIDNKVEFNGFIDIEDIKNLYDLLQNMIILNVHKEGNGYV